MNSKMLSTMLHSSPLATSLSSGALSTSMASLTTAAFIAPPLLVRSRSSSVFSPPRDMVRRRSFVSRRQPPPPPPSSPFVAVEQQPIPALAASKTQSTPTTDPSGFVPSNKSLRHALQVSTSSSSSSSSSTTTSSSQKRLVPPRVVGHRGALYDELENTRQGFVLCADMGCDAVELDVFLLKDGALVVFHGGGDDDRPGDLEDYIVPCSTNSTRVIDMAESILDLTYEQTQQLCFNSAFEEFPCPKDKIQQGRIPTLEEVLLDLKPTKTQVKIELKGPGVVEPVLELVERLGMVDQCQFSSFEHSRLKLLRELRPQLSEDGRHVYKTGALFDDLPVDFISQALAVGASEVHLRYDLCSVDRVNAIHSAGMDSMAWFRGPIGMKNDVEEKFWDIGNEDERCYWALADTGVTALCVNRPDVLIRMLQDDQEQPSQQPQ